MLFVFITKTRLKSVCHDNGKILAGNFNKKRDVKTIFVYLPHHALQCGVRKYREEIEKTMDFDYYEECLKSISIKKL